jgi:NDP-sugar pyrophosphorylase family protein
MNALIPMAGAGSRFKEKGYLTPKPLLPILGMPMVVNAANALPPSQQYVFVVRDFQLEEYQIDEHLKSHFKSSEIVTLNQLTEGQASSCLAAKDLINNDEELIIGASDNGMIYNQIDFVNSSKDADALVFTFRNNPTVLEKPEAYAWAKCNVSNQIEKVSVKKPISHFPMNDHAVVGTFWFKRGSLFVDAAERMIAMNRRVNNEFYVDECINDVIEMGYKVNIFEIQHYVCWGTPNDYETFNYWNNWFEIRNKKFTY